MVRKCVLGTLLTRLNKCDNGMSKWPSKYMHRFLIGYAKAYNRRHHRYGHLFQNRYKSIVCDEVEIST